MIVKLQSFAALMPDPGPCTGLDSGHCGQPPLVSTRCKCFFCSFVIISVIIVFVSALCAVCRLIVNLPHFFLSPLQQCRPHEQLIVVSQDLLAPQLRCVYGALLFYLYKCPRATKIQESLISASKSA